MKREIYNSVTSIEENDHSKVCCPSSELQIKARKRDEKRRREERRGKDKKNLCSQGSNTPIILTQVIIKEESIYYLSKR